MATEIPPYHAAMMRRLGVITDDAGLATNRFKNKLFTQQQIGDINTKTTRNRQGLTEMDALQRRLREAQSFQVSGGPVTPRPAAGNSSGKYSIIYDKQGRVDPINIVNFGKLIQGMGYRVAENPAFGGVDPVHMKGSKHYKATNGIGHAIDVNRYPGTSKKEQDALRQILPLASQYGLRPVFMTAGHYGHAHFDIGW